VKTPSFAGFRAASEASTKAMRANRRRGTTPEVLLEGALRRHGLSFLQHAQSLPGQPDFVFHSARLVVFCDGDFWHGRRWSTLRAALCRRANSSYWIAKIASNRMRDRRQALALKHSGWTVTRFWETDICRNPEAIALRILRVLQQSKDTGGISATNLRASRKARPRKRAVSALR